jgi:hypothetical protein
MLCQLSYGEPEVMALRQKEWSMTFTFFTFYGVLIHGNAPVQLEVIFVEIFKLTG